jgi:hypothetical protein
MILLVCTKTSKKLVWVAKGTETTPAPTGITMANSCATGGICRVGDMEPGCGLVFYNAGSRQTWGRYIEAAPQTWNGGTSDPRAEWGCSGSSIKTVNSVGYGPSNTANILSTCASPNIAARLVGNLTSGGRSDWYLPSETELAYMDFDLKRKGLGDFGNGGYWSSAEYNEDKASSYFFFDGDSSYLPKSVTLFIRPVRTFG